MRLPVSCCSHPLCGLGFEFLFSSENGKESWCNPSKLLKRHSLFLSLGWNKINSLEAQDGAQMCIFLSPFLWLTGCRCPVTFLGATTSHYSEQQQQEESRVCGHHGNGRATQSCGKLWVCMLHEEVTWVNIQNTPGESQRTSVCFRKRWHKSTRYCHTHLCVWKKSDFNKDARNVTTYPNDQKSSQ